jgi:hypothetical protein
VHKSSLPRFTCIENKVRRNWFFLQELLVTVSSWRNKGEIIVLVTPRMYILMLIEYCSELMWTILLYLGWNCWWLWRILSLCSRAGWVWTFQTVLCCWDWRSGSRLTVKFNGSIFAGILIDVSESAWHFSISVWNVIYVFASLTSIWNQIAEN